MIGRTHFISMCLVFSALTGSSRAQDAAAKPVTPIQHVIIVIGENRSFDQLFGTYTPAKPHQTVSNLLSKGIVDANGQPSTNYLLSGQFSAVDNTTYSINPGGKLPYVNVPSPGTAYAKASASDTFPAPFQTMKVAKLVEPNISAKFFPFLLTGATGEKYNSVDTRVLNYATLGAGVFQLTPSVPYDAYAGSPAHRFYQMWQQADCSAAQATAANPSGCLNDLFPWVEVTIGGGNDGAKQPNPFTNITTGEGGSSMGFYNMQQGDAPYLKYLADHYTLSDNMHQAVMGGTGANHIMIGYGDAIYYSDAKGNPATPPATQIENPDPQAGTNNWYTQDGYSGGSYTNCSDMSQPGVPAIVNYLQSLAKPIDPHCATGAYYLLNNFNPGYAGDGQLEKAYSAYTIPPSTVRHIGDVLSKGKVSYTYYGEGWNLYLSDPQLINPYDGYCSQCNPFQYAQDIMTNPNERANHIKDATAFYEAVATDSLPAVSFVKPSSFVDGHPGSSKPDLFEGFVRKIVNQVKANPTLWAGTAIFVTFDESGGYYDSGYIQPVDYFGDGPRIPLLIVSPFSTGGKVNHSYADHVSFLKFIERNWSLQPITSRSRDNFPNPKVTKQNPYVPTNSPALDDLFDAFQFPQ